MTQTDNTTEPDKALSDDLVSAHTEHNERFNHVWWLPLIALLLVLYLAVNYFSTKGPLITITFNTAEGLKADSTEVKYKDVVIGKVESIHFSPEFKGVTAHVRMEKSSENLLRTNTLFWVVKPRIGITQVSGLNTLLSGSYITTEPDKDPNSEFRYDFDGLEIPPIISQDEPGLNLTLLSTKATSLYPGTEIYFKGMKVGTVQRVYFSADYLWIKADVFIAAPHDKLIKQNTKFWTSSSVSVSAGAEGIEVNVESIEALIAGGIAFATPISLAAEDNVPVDSGSEYILFANQQAAQAQNIGRKYYFVTYFNGSIKGLEVGSPVTIQGMKIGKVKDIRLLFDETLAKTKLPVLFEIYEDSFQAAAGTSPPPSQKATNPANNDTANPTANFASITQRLANSGVRTQLETSNLLTGTKNIALVFTENTSPSEALTLAEDPITGYTLLPSTQQSFDALTAGVTNVVNTVNNLPIEAIANNLNDLLKNTNNQINTLAIDKLMQSISDVIADADKKINSIAIEQTVSEANALLKEGKTLSQTAKTTLRTLNRSINQLTKNTNSALSGYSPDGPFYHNINAMLTQLNETLASLQAITELLAQNPSALIFGNEQPKQSADSFWGEK